MFLRPYKRVKDGKEHIYYALVESERTSDGPRQRTVAYLGELNHDQETTLATHRRFLQSPRGRPATSAVSRR